MPASASSSTLAAAPGLVKKEVCFFGAPVPGYMTSLAEYMPAGCHAVILLVAESSESGAAQLVGRFGGRVTYRKTAAEVQASNRTLLEYTWNHTTLVALKSTSRSPTSRARSTRRAISPRSRRSSASSPARS